MTDERDEAEDTWSPGQVREPRPDRDEVEQVPTLEWTGIDQASKAAAAAWQASNHSHGSHRHRRRPRTQTVVFLLASLAIVAAAAVIIVASPSGSSSAVTTPGFAPVTGADPSAGTVPALTMPTIVNSAKAQAYAARKAAREALKAYAAAVAKQQRAAARKAAADAATSTTSTTAAPTTTTTTTPSTTTTVVSGQDAGAPVPNAPGGVTGRP